MAFQVDGSRTFGTMGLAQAKAWGCFLVGWAVVSNSLGQGSCRSPRKEFGFKPLGIGGPLIGFMQEA